AFQDAVRANFTESGFYFFPAPERRPGMTSDQTKQAMEALAKKWATGPAGIMILQRNGRDITSPMFFGAQCGFDILAMLISAIVLARAVRLRGYMLRVGFVTM